MTKLPSKLIIVQSFAAMFLVVLSGCTVIGPGPTPGVVQEGLRMQLSQTQAQLLPQLQISSAPELEITRVKISSQKPMMIEDLQGFQVEGFYDLKIKLPKQVIKQNKKSFKLYIQRQKQAQTWRLARPIKVAGEQTDKWTTYAILDFRF